MSPACPAGPRRRRVSFGLFLGVLWWRYRNLALIILTHLIVNGWGVALELISRVT